jgi:hypothetical protein
VEIDSPLVSWHENVYKQENSSTLCLSLVMVDLPIYLDIFESNYDKLEVFTYIIVQTNLKVKINDERLLVKIISPETPKSLKYSRNQDVTCNVTLFLDADILLTRKVDIEWINSRLNINKIVMYKNPGRLKGEKVNSGVMLFTNSNIVKQCFDTVENATKVCGTGCRDQFILSCYSDAVSIKDFCKQQLKLNVTTMCFVDVIEMASDGILLEKVTIRDDVSTIIHNQYCKYKFLHITTLGRRRLGFKLLHLIKNINSICT